MAEPDLAVLQEWLLTACRSPGQASEGLSTSAGCGVLRAADVVKVSGRLTPEERVDIYARGYRARLRECLKAEFPVLHALVGDQVFGLFAEGYIARHPPRSYSLSDFGAGFADFLQETRPRPLEAPGSPDALPAALARLERARAESRRAPGVETDPAHQPVDPLTVMATPGLTIRTPTTLRLPHLDFVLTDTLAAVDRGDRPTVPAAADTYYAVARTGYHVRVHVLAPWQHAFLSACPADGIVLHAAATATARTCERDLPRMWAALFTWLPLAVEAGMVTCTKSHPTRRDR